MSREEEGTRAKGHAPSPVQEREVPIYHEAGGYLASPSKTEGFLGHRHLKRSQSGQGKLEEILLDLVSGSVGSTKGI